MRYSKTIAILVGVAVILFALAIGPWVFPRKNSAPELAQPEIQQVRRAIDGFFVAPEAVRPPLAGVMVENMVEAQPISGIAGAALVFEAITEANITRFLAYFILDGEELLEIGPVRSARPYYLDLASEFDALYAHVGSSPAAYEMLRKGGVDGVHDLDQWYNPQYFYSKAGRLKPHHIYTTTGLLGEAYHAREEQMANGEEYEVESWIYKNDAPPDLRGDVADISVAYGEPYGVRWLYDKSGNHYKRLQWGGVHTTADGQEIIAKNIAVAFQKMKVLDEIGRKEFTTLGEGQALVFQDGRVVSGIWKKPGAKADALAPGTSSPQERLRFYDAQGQEVEFNAGVTWVQIVPEGYAVGY